MRFPTRTHAAGHPVAAAPAPPGLAPRRETRRPVDRSAVAWRALAGRLVLLWLVAYLVLRDTAPPGLAALQAGLVAVVFAAVGRRIEQAFRAMTFAVGVPTAAAATAAASLLVLSVAAYWVPALRLGHAPLALVAAVTGLGSGLWEALVRRAAPPPPRRVLIVGGGEATARLLDDLARDEAAGYEPVAVVADELHPRIGEAVPYAGALEDLPAAVRRYAPDLVVVAVATGRPQVFANLLEVADAGFQVTGLPEMYEFAFGRLPVEDLTSAWFMSVLHAYQRPSNQAAKRAFDVVVALVGLAVTLPLYPLVAAVVKRTKGPLLYRQVRLGEHGRLFTMIKFRSMRVDAEASGQAQWAQADDPRVIPGGRLLRRLRIDELPQLWNVLRGEMSIVGPRPERPEFLEKLRTEVPFWTQRHLLKPGVTGWAQIRSGYAADALGTAEKLSYDLWYLRHRNLVLDLAICLKTLPRMVLRRGAR